jgi:hypothetical protein
LRVVFVAIPTERRYPVVLRLERGRKYAGFMTPVRPAQGVSDNDDGYDHDGGES